jgi:Ankyrin repeat
MTANHVDLVKFLLISLPGPLDTKSYTPLYLAVGIQRLEIVELLISAELTSVSVASSTARRYTTCLWIYQAKL